MRPTLRRDASLLLYNIIFSLRAIVLILQIFYFSRPLLVVGVLAYILLQYRMLFVLPYTSLTMSKVPSFYCFCFQSLTSKRCAYTNYVKELGLEMSFQYKRCEKKNLCCFVDTATSCCVGCISIKVECSLFIAKEKQKKVQRKKREKRLKIAQLKAQLAQSKLELLEAKA